MTTLVDLLRWGAAGTLGEADAELLYEKLDDAVSLDNMDPLLAALREAFWERERLVADLLAALRTVESYMGGPAEDPCFGTVPEGDFDSDTLDVLATVRAAIDRAKAAR